MLSWLQEGWSLVQCGHIQVVILCHPHHKCGDGSGVKMSTPLTKGHHFASLFPAGRCQHQPLQIQPPSAALLPILFSPEHRTRCWKDSSNNAHQQQDWTNRASAEAAMGEGLVGLNPVQLKGPPLTTAELSLDQLSWAERRWQNGWKSGSDLQDQRSGAEETPHRHLCRTEPSRTVAQPDSGDLFITGFHCFWLRNVGNVSHRSSLAILPLFMMATWAVSGNGPAFVWGSQVDTTYREHQPYVCLFPVLNSFLLDKTPFCIPLLLIVLLL